MNIYLSLLGNSSEKKTNKPSSSQIGVEVQRIEGEYT